MRHVYTAVILLAGLCVLVISLAMGLQRDEARRLWAEGAVTEGTVTEILGTKGSNAKFYSYTFPADGRMHTQTRRDIPWSARDTPVGSRVTVRYDAKSPAKSITQAELEELESWGNRIIFPLIGIALVGWGAARILRRRPA